MAPTHRWMPSLFRQFMKPEISFCWKVKKKRLESRDLRYVFFFGYPNMNLLAFIFMCFLSHFLACAPNTHRHTLSACDAIFSTCAKGAIFTIRCGKSDLFHQLITQKYCTIIHNMHTYTFSIHVHSNALKLCQIEHFSFSIWLERYTM